MNDQPAFRSASQARYARNVPTSPISTNTTVPPALAIARNTRSEEFSRAVRSRRPDTAGPAEPDSLPSNTKHPPSSSHGGQAASRSRLDERYLGTWLQGGLNHGTNRRGLHARKARMNTGLRRLPGPHGRRAPVAPVRMSWHDSATAKLLRKSTR